MIWTAILAVVIFIFGVFVGIGVSGLLPGRGAVPPC
jgi:hypothetical protein